jgi:protein-L-isoaspartate(D-aspartate) O-methyltransferase
MNFAALRSKMVQEQLLNRGIKDPRILSAFSKVPRHKFVPLRYLDSAYEDFPLPIGEEQTISQPYIVALMTECLGLKPDDSILEIGTGSGYQAAILAELTGRVFSIERIGKLAQKAKVCLEDLGYRNIRFKTGDGTGGWPEYAPFNKITITAAAPAIPQPLIEQLSDQGRLVMPVGGRFSQTLTQIIKNKNKIQKQQICGCVFVPLKGRFTRKEENA